MIVREVTDVLEKMAPLSAQESWDNSGLCIGSPQDEVTGILVGLDCTMDVLREAVEKGMNMIVTHHPLIFGGIKNLVPGNPVSDMILYAVKHRLIVYSSHTTMDKAVGGVSYLMAEKLKMTALRPLDESGLGLVGELREPVDGKDFPQYVADAFGIGNMRYSCPVEKVRRVALCGGSGSSFISQAMASGAEAYISGDISYHYFFCREGFMLLDIGHYESEIGIVPAIVSLLKENFLNFAICESTTELNPVNYL